MSLNAASAALTPPRRAHRGMDGFVTAVDLEPSLIRHWHAGAPVIGVAPRASGGLVVATRTGWQRSTPLAAAGSSARALSARCRSANGAPRLPRRHTLNC